MALKTLLNGCFWVRESTNKIVSIWKLQKWFFFGDSKPTSSFSRQWWMSKASTRKQKCRNQCGKESILPSNLQCAQRHNLPNDVAILSIRNDLNKNCFSLGLMWYWLLVTSISFTKASICFFNHLLGKIKNFILDEILQPRLVVTIPLGLMLSKARKRENKADIWPFK